MLRKLADWLMYGGVCLAAAGATGVWVEKRWPALETAYKSDVTARSPRHGVSPPAEWHASESAMVSPMTTGQGKTTTGASTTGSGPVVAAQGGNARGSHEQAQKVYEMELALAKTPRGDAYSRKQAELLVEMRALLRMALEESRAAQTLNAHLRSEIQTLRNDLGVVSAQNQYLRQQIADLEAKLSLPRPGSARSGGTQGSGSALASPLSEGVSSSSKQTNWIEIASHVASIVSGIAAWPIAWKILFLGSFVATLGGVARAVLAIIRFVSRWRKQLNDGIEEGSNPALPKESNPALSKQA